MVKGISGRRRGQKEPVLGHSPGFDMMLGGYLHGHGGTVGGRKAGGSSLGATSRYRGVGGMF